MRTTEISSTHKIRLNISTAMSKQYASTAFYVPQEGGKETGKCLTKVAELLIREDNRQHRIKMVLDLASLL